MKNDIRISGNIIGGRQGVAYIRNSGKFPVIEINLDVPSAEYGEVRFETIRGGRTAYVTGTVCAEDGSLFATCYGSSIKASSGYDDLAEMIHESSLPKIRENEPVAIVMHSPSGRYGQIALYKVPKVNTRCSVIATFEVLNENEMAQIRQDAEAWCNI